MENLYLSQKIPAEETERLQDEEANKYPHELSCKVLIDPKDKSVLDVGAGPNLMLSEYVNNKGGSYVPLDINLEALKSHETGLSFCHIIGDIRDNEVIQEVYRCNFDIIHTRFLLMHLPKEDRPKVLEALIDAGKEQVVFLEHDWQSFHGSSQINKFRDFVLGFADELGFDFFYGSKLEAEAQAATDQEVTVKKHQRPEGLYYYELGPRVKSFRSILKKTQASEKKVKQFEEIITLINFEAELPQPHGFVPPAVVCAMVNK